MKVNVTSEQDRLTVNQIVEKFDVGKTRSKPILK